MIRKSDLSLRIGMTMLALCATLLLTVLPAAAYYNADKPLVTYEQGTVTGGMDYNIGNSTYSPKIWNNDSDTGVVDHYNVNLTPSLPAGATNVTARLYVYWTWSYLNDLNTAYNKGIEPEMEVNFDNQYTFNDPDDSYVDWKDDSQKYLHTVKYNYPSGTYAYDVTDYVDATNANADYYVDISNSRNYANDYDPLTSGNDSQSFNIQAVGLLVVYNVAGSTVTKQYWIDEGCDMTLTSENVLPSQATTRATFSGVDNSSATNVTLITAVPSGNTVNNVLYFNKDTFYPTPGSYITGLWDGNPRDGNFSYDTSYFSTNFLLDGTNTADFRNGLLSDTSYLTNDSQMQAANAFLLVR